MKESLDLEVRDELLRRLAHRAFVDAVSYPILFLVVKFGTTMKFAGLAWCCLALSVFSAVDRILTARKILKHPQPNQANLRSRLRWNISITNAVWSVFSGATLLAEGTDTWNALLLVLIASGISAGGTFSLVSDLKVGRIFIFLMWIGHAPFFAFAGDWTMTGVITFYCSYLAMQGKVLNDILVTALVNQRQLARQTSDLKLANLGALRAQRVAEEATLAKSRFLSTVSHEIRTPLNGVLGTNLLLMDSELSKEQQEYAVTINTCGEALLSLINKVLDFSKLEAGKQVNLPEDFALQELLSESLEIVRYRAKEKNLSLDVTLSEDFQAHVHGDSSHLRQILLNLLSNAIKFTDEGGVRVEARSREANDGKVWVTIRVCDSGIGISEEQKEHLFRPFQQVSSGTTRTRGGTGLGLVISRGMAEQMGGHLTLESELGKGSILCLTLPFDEAKADPSETKPEALLRLNKAGSISTKILIVEDNLTNQKILQRLLTKAGYESDIAINGLEAIECVNKADYGLILMDCYMPGLDGYEATRRIIELLGNKAPDIIAVTANTSEEDRDRCLECGMKGVLSKPIRLKLLQEVLDSHLP